MPSWFDLGNIWKTLREVDLRPIRAEAERVTLLAVVGKDEAARAELIRWLCEEPRRVLPETDASRAGPDPLSSDVGPAARELAADLLILLIQGESAQQIEERGLFDSWRASDKPVLVIVNPVAQYDPAAWRNARALRGSTGDRAFLENQFVPAVLELLPDRHLSLARYYPLFRFRAARQLIQETSMANASYALSTGLAEIIPILDVPFNIADMIVLTKAQAIMAYKLGLSFGLPGRWQEHVATFGGTIGSGFLWRQLARGLVGIVPVWGLLPKVAVAYAGTYVLGEAILQWYTTGRQVTPEGMRRLYREAFEQGKTIAGSLLSRAPRRRGRLRLPSRGVVVCPNCGTTNPRRNRFCGTCGYPLTVEARQLKS